MAGQVTEVVTDIEILKSAVFGEGHENEEEHSTDTAPSTTPVTPTTTPVAPVTPTTPEVTPQPTVPTAPEVTPQPTVPTAPVATEPTSAVPETTAQPVVPTIPAATITTTNLNMEVEHHENTETNIPQGQPAGVPSENTTSTITGI